MLKHSELSFISPNQCLLKGKIKLPDYPAIKNQSSDLLSVFENDWQRKIRSPWLIKNPTLQKSVYNVCLKFRPADFRYLCDFYFSNKIHATPFT